MQPQSRISTHMALIFSRTSLLCFLVFLFQNGPAFFLLFLSSGFACTKNRFVLVDRSLAHSSGLTSQKSRRSGMHTAAIQIATRNIVIMRFIVPYHQGMSRHFRTMGLPRWSASPVHNTCVCCPLKISNRGYFLATHFTRFVARESCSHDVAMSGYTILQISHIR